MRPNVWVWLWLRCVVSVIRGSVFNTTGKSVNFICSMIDDMPLDLYILNRRIKFLQNLMWCWMLCSDMLVDMNCFYYGLSFIVVVVVDIYFLTMCMCVRLCVCVCVCLCMFVLLSYLTNKDSYIRQSKDGFIGSLPTSPKQCFCTTLLNRQTQN